MPILAKEHFFLLPLFLSPLHLALLSLVSKAHRAKGVDALSRAGITMRGRHVVEGASRHLGRRAKGAMHCQGQALH